MITLSREIVAPNDLRTEIFTLAMLGFTEKVPYERANYNGGRSEVMTALETIRRDQERLTKNGASEEAVWERWLQLRRTLFQAFRLGMWGIESIQRNLKSAGAVPFFAEDHALIRTPGDGLICWETGGIVAAEKTGDKILYGPFCQVCHPVIYAEFISRRGTPYPRPADLTQKTA